MLSTGSIMSCRSGLAASGAFPPESTNGDINVFPRPIFVHMVSPRIRPVPAGLTNVVSIRAKNRRRTRGGFPVKKTPQTGRPAAPFFNRKNATKMLKKGRFPVTIVGPCQEEFAILGFRNMNQAAFSSSI
jgi:hypothetical protein